MPDFTPATHTCPQCGAPVAARAPEGLCPRCVAALNLCADTAFTGGAVAPMPSPSQEELAPHFPQLEIIECLGRGGMGVVYKARQKSLNRFVALKLLAPERADDPQFAARFEKEAQALAALNHPHIVAVHDFGQAGGFFYLLMEFVDGVNLRQAMKAGRFTPEQALAVVPPVCEALQYAHEHGIVHRDIKPENLLLDKDGRVKIADFGIAKMLHTEGADVGLAESQPAGTPQYMAPEQKEHRRTDHRADIYSLGVVLYELLTGELPADKLQPPSRKVQIDVRLDEIVLRALEVKPELRFQTAADFRTQVETVAHESGTSRPPQASSGRVLRMVNGVVTTPDRLAATGEQMFLFRRKTQIVLTDREFNFTQDGVPVCVPLSAIRDVSIGRLPRVVNMIGIRIMSVTFDESGARRQFFFFLNDGSWASPGELNRRVSEWVDALSAAVQDATGHAPTRTPADRLGMPPGAPGAMLIMLVPGLIAILCIFGIVWSPPGSFPARFFTIFPVLVFAVAAVVGSLVFALGRRRPSTDEEVSAIENPAGFSRVAIVGAAWFGVALVGILTVAGPIQRGLPWWQTLLSFMILLPTLSAPFGTTILGWVAVSQIRRSAGKLRGLGLAVFDGVLFPLLVLDGFIGWLTFLLTRLVVDFHANPSVVGDPRISPPFLTRLANDLTQQGVSATLLAVTTGLVILVVDFLLIRAVWRAMNRPAPASGPASPATSRSGCLRALAIVGLVVLVVFGTMTGVYFLSRQPYPTVTPSFTQFRLEKNVVILNFQAVISRGPVEVQLVLEGPELSAEAATLVPASNDISDDAEVIAPGQSAEAGRVRILNTSITTWRAAFVFPTEALAREVWENLQPIGPLEVRPDRKTGGELFEVKTATGATYTALFLAGPIRPGPAIGDDFPRGAHIGRNNHSVLVTHDVTALHYVFYYAGDFGSSSSGSQNLPTRSWEDEGAVTLKNGRTFGYRRTARYPDELTVNGTRYDLLKGRVFVLRADSTAEQLKLFPPLPVARDPEALAKLLVAQSPEASTSPAPTSQLEAPATTTTVPKATEPQAIQPQP